jgi:type IV pilus assembly protein PilW
MTQLRNRQTGLTLVELMVATTLSLVLLAGVLLVFSANKTTYQMQGGLGTLQENGRYAVRQITADLQMAGFGGCLSPRLAPRIVSIASSAPSYLTSFAAGDFFTGSDGTSTTYGGKASVAGTDTIEIRGPLRSPVNPVSGEISAAGNVTVLGDSEIAVNDFVMISDCSGGDIFKATAVNTGRTQIGHGTSGNTQATLSRGYAADALVTRLSTHTYFVADTGRTNTTGQPILALYQFDGTNATELVDGVENLQIEYALDTDADGEVDAFRGVDPSGVGTAMVAANWPQVMAVRVSLLINSVNGASSVVAPYTYFPAGSTQITPTNDFRLRQEFTAMVTVRNGVL